MIVQLIAALLGVVGFAVILEVPKKYVLYSGLSGVVGWFVYLVTDRQIGTIVSVFFAAFAIAFISQILARVLKCPVTVFLIPGIYPLVPGAGIYRTVYYLIMSDQGLTTHYLVQTIQTAGMIALGIFMVDMLWRIVKTPRGRKSGNSK